MGTQSFENCIGAIMHQRGMQEPLKEHQLRVKTVHFTFEDARPPLTVLVRERNMRSRLFVEHLLALGGHSDTMVLARKHRELVAQAYGQKLIAEAMADPAEHPILHGLLFAETLTVNA